MFAFPSSCNLLACPSCLLPSCFLPALPVLFASFCDLLSFPYSCNWLAFSCSLLFSLCSSFFAFPYFLLSACLCLLRLAIFPFSCCFRFATAASVLHATLSLVSPYSWSLQLSLCSPLLWRAPPASGRGRRIYGSKHHLQHFRPNCSHHTDSAGWNSYHGCKVVHVAKSMRFDSVWFVMPNLPREHYENSRIILCTAAFSLFSGVTSVLASTLSKNLDFQKLSDRSWSHFLLDLNPPPLDIGSKTKDQNMGTSTDCVTSCTAATSSLQFEFQGQMMDCLLSTQNIEVNH